MNWAILVVISIHFRAFFKTVQNGNVSWGITKFQGGEGGGMPDIPIFWGGWGLGGKTVDAGSKPTHEEKLRVAPINDTFSILSF